MALISSGPTGNAGTCQILTKFMVAAQAAQITPAAETTHPIRSSIRISSIQIYD
jgi:hypothetical protein